MTLARASRRLLREVGLLVGYAAYIGVEGVMLMLGALVGTLFAEWLRHLQIRIQWSTTGIAGVRYIAPHRIPFHSIRTPCLTSTQHSTILHPHITSKQAKNTSHHIASRHVH